MTSRLAGAICVLIAILASGCNIFDRWDAIVYTNRHDPSSSIDIGTFDSLEECRAASLAKLKELRAGKEFGHYVCGENCLVKVGFGNARMCERTSQ